MIWIFFMFRGKCCGNDVFCACGQSCKCRCSECICS